MAKSEAKTVGIVDTEEALTAKIAEVRAAQAIFATHTQIRFSRLLLSLLTRQESHLQRWLLRKQAWVSLKTRLSRTTMLLSTSTISTRMFKLVVFLRKIRLRAQ